jgi:hypothetical protein
MSILLGFLTSKLGGYIIAGIGALIAYASIRLKAYRAGQHAERERVKDAQLHAIEERKAVDEDLSSLSDADVRSRLSRRWRR